MGNPPGVRIPRPPPKRVSYNGIITDFQSEDRSSILLARSNFTNKYCMFSVEFDHDEICITIMDDTGEYGDLKIHSFDDVVFLCQDDPELDTQQILEVNPEMWEELITAIHSPEGFFMRTRK